MATYSIEAWPLIYRDWLKTDRFTTLSRFAEANGMSRATLIAIIKVGNATNNFMEWPSEWPELIG